MPAGTRERLPDAISSFTLKGQCGRLKFARVGTQALGFRQLFDGEADVLENLAPHPPVHDAHGRTNECVSKPSITWWGEP